MKKPSGITLTEGLIFGGIIAVILLASGVTLSAARERARDYKRLSDVARVQVALELYFNEQNAYPVSDGALVLGSAGAKCLSSGGFQSACSSSGKIFLSPVPNQTKSGLSGADLADYIYESNGSAYAISFVIERAIPQAKIDGGLVCALAGEAIKPAKGGKCNF